MPVRRIRAFCCFILLPVTGCGIYNVSFRSLYSLGTDDFKFVEVRLIELYRNGTFKTNSDSLTQLINESLPNGPTINFPNEWSQDGYRKYQLGTVTKQNFVIYYHKTDCYYFLEIANCGGPTGCQIHVDGIIRRNPTAGKRQDVEWADASSSLKDFEDELLPFIKRQLLQ